MIAHSYVFSVHVLVCDVDLLCVLPVTVSPNNGIPAAPAASPAPAASSFRASTGSTNTNTSSAAASFASRSSAGSIPATAAVASITAAPSSAAAAPTANRGSISSGWKEMKTPEGQSYYWNQGTGQTTWEKPEELKTEADRERAGDWIWMPHPVEGFLPAKRISENAQKLVAETEDGRQHTILKKELQGPIEQLRWTQLNQLQRDLVMLDVMSRPLIMYNLRERFKQNEIYTNVGNILISLNPYKWLPLYTPEKLHEYINKGNRKLSPHVFTIADDSYALLRETGQGQSIVISGESGAGQWRTIHAKCIPRITSQSTHNSTISVCAAFQVRRSVPSSVCSILPRLQAVPATSSSAFY